MEGETVDLLVLIDPISSYEKGVIMRFYFPKDRKHFFSARRLLGFILGYYLARDPPRRQFCYSQYGKPILAWKSSGIALSLNLTRSKGWLSMLWHITEKLALILNGSISER
jgi:phosphopantetheinyl transferase